MNIDENVQKNECGCNTENGKKMMEMLETERKELFPNFMILHCRILPILFI